MSHPPARNNLSEISEADLIQMGLSTENNNKGESAYTNNMCDR